jgi:hypothetical protein
MKLRIRGDSIRLRLKRGEVAELAAGKSVAEETHFPDSVLTYRLDVSEGNNIEASFAGGNLVVSLPSSKALGWVTNDEVSLTDTQSLANGATLTLLIEKDFECLDPGHGRDEEDDADSYPHPSAASGV